jgi:hypothetical protein
MLVMMKTSVLIVPWAIKKGSIWVITGFFR